MPNERTQSLIAKVASPKHASKMDIVTAVEAMVPVLTRASPEAMEVRSLSQLAHLAEQDAVVKGKLEPYWQTAGAIQREVANAEKAIRRIANLFEQLEACNASCQAAAAVVEEA
ncbi:MAG: hypothetical protein WD737_08510 [Gemmatimonadota bacterium]